MEETFIIILLIANLVIGIGNNFKMSEMEDRFLTALGRIDTATTGIATQLRDLKDQLTNAGLPSDKEAEILGKLENAATRLESIGANPENPTGEEPPGGDTDAGNETEEEGS